MMSCADKARQKSRSTDILTIPAPVLNSWRFPMLWGGNLSLIGWVLRSPWFEVLLMGGEPK
jgi:hypothetical protein